MHNLNTVEILGSCVEYKHLEGDEPTLILIPGSGGNCCVFNALLDCLDGMSVIVPNLPGRMGSEGEPPETALQAAVWLGEVIEALQLSDVVLAGHSYGGAIAIEAALMAAEGKTPYADCLRSIVLMGTGGKLRVHPHILEMMRQAAESGSHMPQDFAFQPGTDPDTIARCNQDSALTPPQTVYLDWLAVNRFDRLRELGKIQVPAWVLCGSNDVLTPLKYATTMAEQIPQGELVVLQNAGHMFPMEQPKQVASWLRAGCGLVSQ